MKYIALAVGIFSVWGACLADDNADINIYTDYVVGDWAIRSTGALDLSAVYARHSYEKSVQVGLSPGTNLQLAVTWDLQDTTGISALEFWIAGAGSSQVDFNIQAVTLRMWAGGPVRTLSQYARLSTSFWRRVRIPLADLGLQPGEALFNVTFSTSPSASPQNFYMDDVKLIKPALVGNTVLRVDSANVVRTFDKKMFGAGTSAGDYWLDRQDSRDRVAEAGITFMNFPGGSKADKYDWQTGANKDDGSMNGLHTTQYLQLADSVGAEKMICVNYGSGTPEEAAAWVRHANIDNNGNVMYWSIGNECYGEFEYDTRPAPYRHDAETYAAFVRDCIVQMKAVDPRIKIGVVGMTSPNVYPQRTTVINPRTGAAQNGWSAVVLSRLAQWGTLPDYYDCHWYSLAPGREDDATLLQYSTRMQAMMAEGRPMLVDYLGAAGQTIPVHLTESNSSWGISKQLSSMVNAIYMADFWGNVNKIGLGSFTWWTVHSELEPGSTNATLYGWRNFGTLALLSMGAIGNYSEPLNTRFPAFFSFKLIKQFARPGDTMLSATTNNELLSVYGSRSATTGKVRYLVINRAAKKDISAYLQLTGYTMGRRATVYRYGAKEDLAQTDVVQTNPSISPTTSNGVMSVRMTFPRYSISVVEF